MEKFKYKYVNYVAALERLNEALKISNPDDVYVDGVIQRFEFVFELSWKTIKEYLIYSGYDIVSVGPRGILKTAFSAGIIEDGEEWIEMMDARNSLSHMYSFEMSRNIYNDIKNKYIVLFDKLKEKLS